MKDRSDTGDEWKTDVEINFEVDRRNSEATMMNFVKDVFYIFSMQVLLFNRR